MELGQIDLKQEAAGREKIYFAVILLLIVVAFSRWFYLPKMKQIKMLNVDIKNNSMQIDTLKQFAQLKIPAPPPKQADEQINLKGGTKFEKAVEASMRSQQQVVADIIKMMTSNNVLNGVSLSGMSFAAEVNKGSYIAVPISIDLEGKYTGILNYLEKVEKFGKLITVDNIDVKVEEKNPTKVMAKLGASIYVVNPNPNGATTGTVQSGATVQPPSGGSAPTPAQPSGSLGGPPGR